MSVLVFNEEVKAACAAVVAYAEAHRITLRQILHTQAHPEDAPGATPGYVVLIPLRLRCVFTIEQQPGGWFRHLSMSLLHKTMLPNEIAVAHVLPLFGFTQDWRECAKEGLIYTQQERWAILNVLEKLPEAKP